MAAAPPSCAQRWDDDTLTKVLVVFIAEVPAKQTGGKAAAPPVQEEALSPVQSAWRSLAKTGAGALGHVPDEALNFCALGTPSVLFFEKNTWSQASHQAQTLLVEKKLLTATEDELKCSAFGSNGRLEQGTVQGPVIPRIAFSQWAGTTLARGVAALYNGRVLNTFPQTFTWLDPQGEEIGSMPLFVVWFDRKSQRYWPDCGPVDTHSSLGNVLKSIVNDYDALQQGWYFRAIVYMLGVVFGVTASTWNSLSARRQDQLLRRVKLAVRRALPRFKRFLVTPRYKHRGRSRRRRSRDRLKPARVPRKRSDEEEDEEEEEDDDQSDERVRDRNKSQLRTSLASSSSSGARLRPTTQAQETELARLVAAEAFDQERHLAPLSPPRSPAGPTPLRVPSAVRASIAAPPPPQAAVAPPPLRPLPPPPAVLVVPPPPLPQTLASPPPPPAQPPQTESRARRGARDLRVGPGEQNFCRRTADPERRRVLGYDAAEDCTLRHTRDSMDDLFCPSSLALMQDLTRQLQSLRRTRDSEQRVSGDSAEVARLTRLISEVEDELDLVRSQRRTGDCLDAHETGDQGGQGEPTQDRPSELETTACRDLHAHVRRYDEYEREVQAERDACAQNLAALASDADPERKAALAACVQTQDEKLAKLVLDRETERWALRLLRFSQDPSDTCEAFAYPESSGEEMGLQSCYALYRLNQFADAYNAELGDELAQRPDDVALRARKAQLEVDAQAVKARTKASRCAERLEAASWSFDVGPDFPI